MWLVPVRVEMVVTGFPDEFRQICVRGGYFGVLAAPVSGGRYAARGNFGGAGYYHVQSKNVKPKR